MNKPSLDLSQMIQLLGHRGMVIDTDESEKLRDFLIDVNYYRASGYWRYLQVAPHLGDNDFIPGTSATTLLDVYEFDQRLRNYLMDGVSAFEIALRSRIAYAIAQKYPQNAYLSSSIYRNEIPSLVPGKSKTVSDLLSVIQGNIKRSKEPYIVRHIEASTVPPIWVAIEAMSMGTVSKIYQFLLDEDVRYFVAKSFGLPNPEIAESTFRSFTILRNLCAHQARIWNRVPDYPHSVLKALKTDRDKSIYHRTPWAWIVSLGHQVDQIKRDNTYSSMLMDFLDEYPEFWEGLKYPHSR